ncbi:uncharacterized protein BO88DRAFT_444904 [Aspergillus vadensis CBS 113365]|uniref:Integral membrane protein n=1 Tax=Aspergillus vadensis (strain CBS 113365 / IMI 142717 / IBT 24658) TaxID=1448311 RepID=A0A319CHL8_ASPVC|nr:hypothetical protein BO88DRAFT_444904 [Aspergillus vadensis CBS 113365]PYH67722.1 hypothetical protein BO88DRAFT_444904 [Aspergillus vadensis CBS 113365]
MFTMMSPTEQVLVYGRTLNPEYESLDMLDLTAGLDTVFAALILFFFVAVNWHTITSGISFGAKLLAAVISPLEFLVACADAAKRWMVQSQMGRRLSDLRNWYFPARRPIAMISRVYVTIVTLMWTSQDLLTPGYHVLYGMADGMGPAGWDHWEYCLNLGRGSPAGRWSSSRRLQGFHCDGVDLGVELFSVWEDYVPTFSVGDDIEHLQIFRFVCLVLALASILAGAVIAIRHSSPVKAIETLCSWTCSKSKNGPEDEAQHQDTALLEQVGLLSARIGTYEAMLDEVRGQLAAKTEQANGLEVRFDELRSRNQMLVARCEEDKVAQQENLIAGLRQELDRVNCRLIMANGRARGAQYKSDSREQTLTNRVAELEEQLARKSDEANANSRGIIESLQADLRNRTDELNAMARRVEAVEALAERTCDIEKLRVTEEEGLRKDAEISRLQELLQVQEQQSYERARELSIVEDQLSKQEVEILDLGAKIKAYEAAPQVQATEPNAAEIRELEGKLRFFQAQCHTQAAQLGTAEAQVNVLQAQLEGYSEQLRIAEAQHVKLEAEGSAKQAEIEFMSQQYDTLFAEHFHLTGQHKNLSEQHEKLQSAFKGDDAAQEILGLRAEIESLKSALDRNSAAQETLNLRVEVNAVKAVAEEKVREAEAKATEAEQKMMEAEGVANFLRQADEGHRKTMKSLKDAYDKEVERYDDEVAAERAAADEARKQVKGLEEELKEMSRQVGIASRDAQRFREQKEGTEAERDKLTGVNDVLEHRLKFWENSESMQTIPKRRTGDLGSLATALDEARVEISRQQTEINGLRAKLQAQTESAASAASAPSDQALQDSVNHLRQALEVEKRQRTEDQVRWGRQVQELQQENQRLRVSISSAGLGRGRGRGRGRGG